MASIPMLRAMLLEFPNDPNCRMLDRQYMLGPSLLVAPVFHDKKAEYYLPDGNWTHLLTGETRAGGRWYFDEQDFFSVPLWLRENSVALVGSEHTQVDYDLTKNVRLVCGKLDGKATLNAPLFDARGQFVTTFEVAQQGRRLRVKNSSGLAGFELHLPWAAQADEVQGGSVVSEARAPLTQRGIVIRVQAAEVSFRYSQE
jgi:alpha-D-xyloside xylohydrolase